MKNHGAVSAVLGSGVTQYTIPEGYHNGKGVVTYNKKVATLNSSYPQDVSQMASASGSATFKVVISADGEPASYTYQWYKNSAAVSGANGATYTISGLTSAATYSIYCTVKNDAGTVTSRVATLTVGSPTPIYTYTGTSQFIQDSTYNWRIKFTTSGTLNFSYLGNASSGVDVFCVGGGGGSAWRTDDITTGAGGGRTTTTKGSTVKVNTNYSVVVGAGGSKPSGNNQKGGDGGTSSITALNCSAAGGVGGNGTPDGRVSTTSYFSGSGGGGAGWWGGSGTGGSDGSHGNGPTNSYEYGQGSTTREFGESGGTLYSGGGAGGVRRTADRDWSPLAGGAGGGGQGGCITPVEDTEDIIQPSSGAINTGGGAGGSAWGKGASGGSGIVVIRNHR